MSNTVHRVEDEVKEHLTYTSGEQGSTGREPFEDSIATAGGQAYSSDNTSGQGAGVMSSSTLPGQHHGDHQHGAHGVTPGSGLGAGLTGHEGHSHHHSHQHGSTTDRIQGEIGGTGDRYGTTGQSGASKIDEATRDRLPSHHEDKNRPEGYGQGVGGNNQPSGGNGQGVDSAMYFSHQNQERPHDSALTANSAVGDKNNTYANDKVGSLGENSANYERTDASGPKTSGAAGTDRFDTDRTHGAGSYGGGNRAPGEATERAEGKGTGGVGGVLGTTDKEFTGRDRLGDGAYNDDNAHFQDNKSGPGGNTALTGREGDRAHNPVAQDSHAGGATGAHAGVQDTQHKEGMMEKVKHAVGL